VAVASLAGFSYLRLRSLQSGSRAAIDRMGAKVVASLGALATAAGALLFVRRR
jgi:hypothetical protein